MVSTTRAREAACAATALGLCIEDRVGDAISLLRNIIAMGFYPNVKTWGTLVNGLCRSGNVGIALRVHREIRDGDVGCGLRFNPNLIYYCCLLDGLAKEGLLEEAKELFAEMEGRGISADVVAFGTLIDGLCKMGDWEGAKGLFFQMMDRGIRPNVLTFNMLIYALCREGKTDEARGMLDFMLERGEEPDFIMYNTLMVGYCHEGRLDDARGFITSWKRQWPFSEICLLEKIINRRFLQVGNIVAVHDLYSKMEGHGVAPVSSTYNILLDGFCKNDSLGEAIELFQSLEKSCYKLNSHACNCLLDGLCKAGKLDQACEIFERLPNMGLAPTPYTYSIMINGFCKNGQLEKAKDLSQKIMPLR
ncbi:hypothetical protein SASPL_106554 [Salvia splendens]|uniref:Pentatricopeptide repeat-containing protein n=1 Tax=Salvia splendens TaxID=180675 RepID=A0A8X8YL66_SALSN|nr:hypothetical protein SASPL_106554 [Salvia splendens]